MSVKVLLNVILGDEHLTRGLGDEEARMLVEWLVARAERQYDLGAGHAVDLPEVRALCRRGRSLSRFVSLWCYREDHGAALQLAASERFAWPLPVCPMDPCDLMADILMWEDEIRPLKPVHATSRRAA